MLHQLLATICGITIHTQVNACRITLQQATVDYNRILNSKVEQIKQRVEPHIRNDYTDKIFLVSKVVYDKQIVFTTNGFNFNMRTNKVLCTWQLTF